MPSSVRSQGHVEFMISLVLFITAILLLFIFLNPIGKTESKTKIQENAEKIIIENLSAVVERLDVITTHPKHCYSFSLTSYGSNFYETFVDAIGKNRSYELYFSPEVINEHLNYKETGCNENKYFIGVRSRENLIIKNKTISLKKNYEKDYGGTKKALGISNDFSFSFKYLNGSIVNELSVERTTSSNVEKYASEYPVRIIDDRANIVEMIINIRLW